MKKVIKHGDTMKSTYICTCPNCGCEFECDESDIFNDFNLTTYSKFTYCPECGAFVNITQTQVKPIPCNTLVNNDYSPCENCPNAKKNGGGGICHCILGLPKIT